MYILLLGHGSIPGLLMAPGPHFEPQASGAFHTMFPVSAFTLILTNHLMLDIGSLVVTETDTDMSKVVKSNARSETSDQNS